MSDQNGSVPKFNFDNVSMKWGTAWQRSVTRATELQLGLQELDAAGDGQDAVEKSRKTVELMHELENISAEQKRLIAQVLVDVPRDWLASDAPDELNWRDAAALENLLERKYPQLIVELNTARRAVPKT